MEISETQLRMLKFVLYDGYLKDRKYGDLSWNQRVDKIVSELVIQLPIIDENNLRKFVKESLFVQDINVIDEKYVPWLEDVKASISWDQSSAYYTYLLSKKNWDLNTVSSLNDSTDVILDHMGNPRIHKFLKRGLVIGDIQSGKTANFTYLINKSIDVGYKFIILLSGMHNDLRSQTQIRIENEVLGYTTTEESLNDKIIGIGEIPKFEAKVETMTGRGPNDDFKKAYGKLIQGSKNPLICVVKKNSSVLNNLIQFIKDDISKNKGDKLDVPVLIIDDEVDQASVNTKDIKNQPTTINKLIRSIINLCNKVSYVGYTATPYANVFINDSDETMTEEYSSDLFPKDFIVSLPLSKNYCGVSKFFGVKEESNYDLVRIIDDEESFVEDAVLDKYDRIRFKAGDVITKLNKSIKNAIDDFIVASAVRRSREGKVHCAMMVHIAAYITPATTLKLLIEQYINRLKVNYVNELSHYKDVWFNHFKNISSKGRFGYITDKFGEDSWERIEPHISSVFKSLEIKLLNGDSNDFIDYTNIDESEYIVVGGNKLSRGLTIEGLMISYYLRTPSAYDVAMQMGRWFGYKDKYLDLCRIYSKQELIEDFIHIFDATEELRNDVDLMNSLDLTPRQFGLKIKSHPLMKPTSLSKMRCGTTLFLSFENTLQQTIKFNLSKKQDNLIYTNEFIFNLGKNYNYELDKHNVIFSDVESKDVLNYLKNYIGSLDDTFDNTELWIKYIEKANRFGELINWTVVLASLEKGDTLRIGGFDIYKSQRSMMKGNPSSTRVISRPDDFKYIFESESDLRKEYTNTAYKKNDPKILEVFKKEKALMVIYPLDMTAPSRGGIVEKDLVGLAIWFPSSDILSGSVPYHVTQKYLETMNNDYLEGEY